MEIYQILCLLGVPAIIAALRTWILSLISKNKKENESLKVGVQALLRNELIRSYKEAKRDGYVDIDDRENWINMYNQYHALGVNGVMDNIKEKYLALPTEEE